MIDNWLLDCVFQPASDWVQKIIGWNNFTLARVTVVLWFLASYIYDSIKSLEATPLMKTVTFITPVILISMSYIEEWIFMNERSIKQIGLILNSLRVRLRLIRRLNLILCAFMFLYLFLSLLLRSSITQVAVISRICTCVGVITYLAFFYFLSCTPLPPGKSKLKKLIEGLKERARSLEPKAQPA